MRITVPSLKGTVPALACALAAFTIFQTSTILAATSSISDGNSSITFDPASATGVNNWTVDGCNQLDQQAFFYRLGGAGPALAISTISAPTISQTASTLTTTYANAQVSVQIIYSLTGGSLGSHNSSLGIQFGIQNLSGSTLSFYDYANFSLGNSGNTTMLGLNLQNQFNEADVSGANGAFANTSFNRGATAGEAAFLDSTLTKLASGTPLSGNATAGPGDTTWALQWDFTSGQSVTFSSVTDLHSVPDAPGRLVTWMGLGALLLMVRFIPRLEYRLARA